MKKRIIFSVLLVLAMMLMLSACGKTTPTGSWKVDHFLVNDEEVSCEDIVEVTGEKEYAKWSKTAFVFKSSGTVNATWPTQGDSMKELTHSYRFDEEVGRIQVLMTDTGENFEVMYLEDGVIRFPLNSSVTMILK